MSPSLQYEFDGAELVCARAFRRFLLFYKVGIYLKILLYSHIIIGLSLRWLLCKYNIRKSYHRPYLK